MEKKINIAELLKDCPSGMELDCSSYDNVSFDKISDDKKATYPIFCYITDEKGNRSGISFTKNGCESKRYGAKCVIFPKGKTTWEGFVPPIEFKDGDILATDLGSVFFLNTHLNTDECYGCYVGIGCGGLLRICEPFAYKECCGLATEEEKQKLFDAIKANGYKWNAETKTLEKLIEQKFDITTLKPFDKVLVRDTNGQVWTADLFSHIMSNTNPNLRTTFVCVGHYPDQCIPFKGNEHLLGKTDDCDEFYKTWE